MPYTDTAASLPLFLKLAIFHNNGTLISTLRLLGPIAVIRNHTREFDLCPFFRAHIILRSTLTSWLETRSIPSNRDNRPQELYALGLPPTASLWEIVQAYGGRSVADPLWIRVDAAWPHV